MSAFLSTVSPPPPPSSRPPSPPPLLPQPPLLFPLLFPSVSYYHQCRVIPPPSAPRIAQKERDRERKHNPASQASRSQPASHQLLSGTISHRSFHHALFSTLASFFLHAWPAYRTDPETPLKDASLSFFVSYPYDFRLFLSLWFTPFLFFLLFCCLVLHFSSSSSQFSFCSISYCYLIPFARRNHEELSELFPRGKSSFCCSVENLIAKDPDEPRLAFRRTDVVIREDRSCGYSWHVNCEGTRRVSTVQRETIWRLLFFSRKKLERRFGINLTTLYQPVAIISAAQTALLACLKLITELENQCLKFRFNTRRCSNKCWWIVPSPFVPFFFRLLLNRNYRSLRVIVAFIIPCPHANVFCLQFVSEFV